MTDVEIGNIQNMEDRHSYVAVRFFIFINFAIEKIEKLLYLF